MLRWNEIEKRACGGEIDAGPFLDLIPAQERQDVDVDDLLDAFLEPLHLILRFREARLRGQLDELLVIVMGHLLAGSVRAKLNCLLIGQDGRERIFDAGVELIGLRVVLLGELLEVFEGSQGILVEAIEVLQGNWVTD